MSAPERAAADLKARGWTVLPPRPRRSFRCGRCGYRWEGRVATPKFCPRCHCVTVEAIP